MLGIAYVGVKQYQLIKKSLKSKKEDFIFELLMKERIDQGKKDGDGSSDEEMRQKELRKLRQKFNSKKQVSCLTSVFCSNLDIGIYILFLNLRNLISKLNFSLQLLFLHFESNLINFTTFLLEYMLRPPGPPARSAWVWGRIICSYTYSLSYFFISL